MIKIFFYALWLVLLVNHSLAQTRNPWVPPPIGDALDSDWERLDPFSRSQIKQAEDAYKACALKKMADLAQRNDPINSVNEIEAFVGPQCDVYFTSIKELLRSKSATLRAPDAFFNQIRTSVAASLKPSYDRIINAQKENEAAGGNYLLILNTSSDDLQKSLSGDLVFTPKYSDGLKYHSMYPEDAAVGAQLLGLNNDSEFNKALKLIFEAGTKKTFSEDWARTGWTFQALPPNYETKPLYANVSQCITQGVCKIYAKVTIGYIKQVLKYVRDKNNKQLSVIINANEANMDDVSAVRLATVDRSICVTKDKKSSIAVRGLLVDADFRNWIQNVTQKEIANDGAINPKNEYDSMDALYLGMKSRCGFVVERLENLKPFVAALERDKIAFTLYPSILGKDAAILNYAKSIGFKSRDDWDFTQAASISITAKELEVIKAANLNNVRDLNDVIKRIQTTGYSEDVTVPVVLQFLADEKEAGATGTTARQVLASRLRKEYQKSEAEKLAFIKEYPYEIIITCGLNGNLTSIIPCLHRDSIDSVINLRNGSQSSALNYANFDNAGRYKKDGFVISVKKDFAISIQNVSDILILSVQIADASTGKKLWSAEAGQFQYIIKTQDGSLPITNNNGSKEN